MFTTNELNTSVKVVQRHLLTYFLLVSCTLLSADINISQAKKIPSIIEFDKRTVYSLDKHLHIALKDKEWQRANDKLLNERVQIKRAKKTYTSIDYDGIIELLYTSAQKGVLIAAFQGYELSTTLTRKRGKWAKRDIPRFAAILMQNNICQGYLDMGYAYAYKWMDGTTNYKQAAKIVNAGKASCMDKRMPGYLHRYWGEYSAKYNALARWKKEKKQ